MILALTLPLVAALGGAGGALVLVPFRSCRWFLAACAMSGFALVDAFLWIGEPWW